MTISSPSRLFGDASPGLMRVESLAELIRLAPHIDAPTVFNGALTALDLEKLALMFGGGFQDTRTFGHIREIRNDPTNTLSIAESLARHPLHTDATFWHAPPVLFMLYFVKTDPNGGGVSQFLPISELLARLEPEYVIALALGTVAYAREDRRGFKDVWTGPLLSHDAHGDWLMRWRYDEMVRPEIIEDPRGCMEEAIQRVKALADSLPKLEYAAVENDLVVVPNRTWLHGRTPLSESSDRLVLRAWIS